MYRTAGRGLPFAGRCCILKEQQIRVSVGASFGGFGKKRVPTDVDFGKFDIATMTFI